MSRTYRSPGNTIPWTNDTAAAVVSGELVAFGNVIGVALGDIAIGASGDLSIEGIHEVAKVSTADALVGTLLQLDVTQTPNALEDAAATPASGDITGGALCIAAAASGATVVQVKLLPGCGAVTA